MSHEEFSSHIRMIKLASSLSAVKGGIWQLKNKLQTDETSHERQFHTQENDYTGEFHMAIEKQIIDR